MLRVGLTGGIGAGKSTVAGRLDELGATLIDADRIAREVVEPGTAGLEAVVAEFGTEVLDADGALDRSRLGRIVFDDDERRRALNAIVHPLVYRRREQLVDEAGPAAVVVEDIPLLVENGLAPSYPLVLVVHADEETRVRRLVADRGMSASDVRARIAAQATDADRRAVADVWLDNSGPPERTVETLDRLWHDRVVPFEANLRAGVRAARPEHVVIAEPDPSWADDAHRMAQRVLRVAGESALRVDHIGSTAVPGLAAKNVVDLQIVVADLATAVEVAGALPAAGLVRMPDRWWDVGRDGRAWDKELACNADPARAVNCHIRPESSPAWRDALLLRDRLRAAPDDGAEYAALKRRLAARGYGSVDEYAAAKTSWINAMLERADAWAKRVGWRP
ncbi:dephospho-CoA kinase [Haloactinopolyspora alba]|uniref:Dephospho-CoA kinase n=1 Tax=Haloactinopolyspora alba TaxID=648780 RepID=A0A2P8E3L4_9ACTN|nr:dephospho-CoA kinase [Haloactinopolyspora alba]PSL04063.1 dephospho-CoA kinase [Haloactinopolyspora alba]